MVDRGAFYRVTWGMVGREWGLPGGIVDYRQSAVQDTGQVQVLLGDLKAIAASLAS